MNEIYHRRYLIEFDSWEPQRLLVDEEFDHLLSDIKTKKILPHAGNVKITLVAEDRLGVRPAPSE